MVSRQEIELARREFVRSDVSGGIAELVYGLHDATHSQWLVKGRLGAKTEELHFVFCVFAKRTREGVGLLIPCIWGPERRAKLQERLEEITGFELPRRVQYLEGRHYAQYPPEVREQILNVAKEFSEHRLLPVVAIAYGRTAESNEESAFLVCPTILPPSIGLRQAVEVAREELQTRSLF